MTHIATLIANPETALDGAVLTRVRGVLPGAGEPVWLDPGIAADIPFTPDDGADQRLSSARVREALAGAAIDAVVQARQHRRKKLLVADMDSTMIGQECIDELADYAGLKAHVAAITERAMRGEVEFAPALRERVALLKGLPASVVDEVIATRIKPTPGGLTLVATMRANGAHTCLVSGGFSVFTQRVAAMIGFDESHANALVIQDGKMAGFVEEPVLGREAKLDTLLELSRHLRVAMEETLAVGDGANDLAMIGAAGLGVAYRAKPAVAAAAHARIDHCDLTALLYAQGYRRQDFVENPPP